MVGEIEAAAELAQGTLMGRAIEPDASGRGPGGCVPQPGECLNCCTPLQGDYCHHCGQHAHTHRTIRGLMHDIIHGVFHFDGKFWHTIPLLVFKPGELTRRYISGQRARFISPIALYLFTIVAMFALVVSIGDVEKSDVRLGGQEPETTIEAQEARIADLEESIADLSQSDVPGIKTAIRSLQANLDLSRKQLAEMKGEEAAPASNSETNTVAPIRIDADIDKEGESGGGVVDGMLDGFKENAAHIDDNPALFFTKVSMKAYKLSWLLIPLSLPFMWLLFPFSRRFRMYDHAIFVTYSIAFMTLLVTVTSVVSKFVGSGLIALAILYVPYHMYRQLKGTYGLSRAGALGRTVLLLVFSGIALALFLAIIFALGAIG